MGEVLPGVGESVKRENEQERSTSPPAFRVPGFRRSEFLRQSQFNLFRFYEYNRFRAARFLALSFLREKLFTSRPAITVQPAGRVPVVVPPLPLAIRRSP
jgi:hypothetical protein